MAKIKVKMVDGIGRKKIADAFSAFMRHCQLKNLAPYSIRYYNDNIKFVLKTMPQVKFVDEITQELIDEFIGKEMDRGNKVTAINACLICFLTLLL